MKWLTALAVFCEAGVVADRVQAAATPTCCGSVSLTCVAQVVAAEDDDEAMLAHRLDEDLDAGHA